jgi:hypothetical protein
LSFPILLRERGCTRQNNADLSVLSGLAIDLYRPRMLFDNDVMTDGQAEPSPFADRFRRVERGEHLFPHLGSYPDAVITDRNLHPVAEVFGSRRKGRLIAVAVGLRFSLRRGIKAIGDRPWSIP